MPKRPDPFGATVGVSTKKVFTQLNFRQKALELASRLGIRDSLCGICIRACPVGKELLA